MSLARNERLALVRTMLELGPEAPTLCGDLTVRDLAAHLVIQERRIDAAAGIVLTPLATYTAKVQAAVAARPWPTLAEAVRSGPPVWSPYRLLDSRINLGEMFVHHEDMRRAGDHWVPRTLTVELDSALWKLVRLVGRMGYRRSPTSVTARTPDGRQWVFQQGHRPGPVLTGEPAELLMHAFGRSATVLNFDGDDADIAAVNALDRGM